METPCEKALIYLVLTKQCLKKAFPTSNDFVPNGSSLHVPSRSPFCLSGTFDLFNITCKQQHRSSLNPFLNCTNNGEFDSTYKRALREVVLYEGGQAWDIPLDRKEVVVIFRAAASGLGAPPNSVARLGAKPQIGLLFDTSCSFFLRVALSHKLGYFWVVIFY